jgi:hypothetical protein
MPVAVVVAIAMALAAAVMIAWPLVCEGQAGGAQQGQCDE